LAYLTLFVIAFAASAGATIPPGLLNMNAARIRVANGSGPALRFIAGVATVIAVEAWAAAAFSKFVYENPEVQRNFLWLGIGVFSLLTWYFFNRSQKSVEALKDQRNFFLRGSIMGALNVLNIPFYAVMHAVLRNASLVRLAPSETLVFAAAAMSGTAVVLFGYSYGSSKVNFEELNFQRHSNRMIGFVMFALAVISLIRLIWSYV
jgi:threonine/homoserine/homoserine lactone efflux protein